ncbi:discoidin domain-containing protein, partial [Flavobacterium sufflavum]|uniref:discoidin domain-containing protein n=1 Tax=Flavobacterium sufflavum TaxID=1921138 RepID=UPI0013E8B6DF
LAVNRSKWKIAYADSEEVSVGNYSAEKIFDQQESTFWSTAWTVSKTPHPHQLVVNMDDNVKIKGFRYLPRTDKSTNGNVKSYRFYIKPNLFSIKK